MPAVKFRLKGLKNMSLDAPLDRVRAGMEAMAALRVTAERYRRKLELLRRLSQEKSEESRPEL